MKSSFLLLAPLVLATSAANDEISLHYDPEEGTVLRRVFEATQEEDLQMSMFLDGEELVMQESEIVFTSVETIEVEDELESVEDGRPTELVRTFTDLRQDATIELGEDEKEMLSISDLEGRVLRFEWDEDAEYYTVETDDDGPELDEETLEWLEEDMDLRAVLPGDEVEVGDSWDIDETAYLPLMWPGGLLGFYDEEDGGTHDYVRELNREKIENLSGEGEATLVEVRDEDGTRVAVIRIELEVETEAEATNDEGPVEIVHTYTSERTIGGEILWDLDHDHLHSVDAEADFKTISARERTVELDGEQHLEERDSYEGTIRYLVTVERE